MCWCGGLHTHIKISITDHTNLQLFQETPNADTSNLRVTMHSVVTENSQLDYAPSWIPALSWQRGLRNSGKLRTLLCRATQVEPVIVKSSDQTWSAGGGNGKPLQSSCLENPIGSMKRQKDMTLEDEPRPLSP